MKERMVPAQQLADAGLVRLAAAKDAEIATLTADRDDWRYQSRQRDLWVGELNDEIAALTEQRDRAMAVVEAARDIHAWLVRNGFAHSAHGRYLGETLAALDAEATAETAPSLPETP